MSQAGSWFFSSSRLAKLKEVAGSDLDVESLVVQTEHEMVPDRSLELRHLT